MNYSDYVLTVSAESPDFEESVRGGDTNFFRQAIVFSNCTSDNNVIVSTFLSLSFNADTSDRSWCQLLARDGWFIFRI